MCIRDRCERARNYLSSEKGERDIYEMLDTFFNEKGRIIGLLQMFMTKESIADRIQHELIRLTQLYQIHYSHLKT